MAFAKNTEYIKITPENLENSAERAAEILQSGGLVAIPTETVYGLAGNALDGNIVKKIYTAKGRPSDNPLIVHVNNLLTKVYQVKLYSLQNVKTFIFYVSQLYI